MPPVSIRLYQDFPNWKLPLKLEHTEESSGHNPCCAEQSARQWETQGTGSRSALQWNCCKLYSDSHKQKCSDPTLKTTMHYPCTRTSSCLANVSLCPNVCFSWLRSWQIPTMHHTQSVAAPSEPDGWQAFSSTCQVKSREKISYEFSCHGA